MLKKFKYLIIFFCLFASLLLAEEYNCFTILAGKEATRSGSVLIAHNEDDSGNQIVNFYKVGPQSHSPREYVELKNGAQVAQSSSTNGYIWLEMPGMDFSDSYFNDNGVVIVSDACPSKENRNDLTEGGIGYWLRRLMAERASSAREAVTIGGRLVEKFGYYSSGRSYCIADTSEAWIMAVVKGRHWVAQRIPNKHVAVIPNYYTIQEVNLKDTLNYLGCDDLKNYAQKRGWYNPSTDSIFNFRKAYGKALKDPHNVNRMWRGLNLLSNKSYNLKSMEQIPFSFQPGQLVEINDLLNVLRDHYQGTELALNYPENAHSNQNRPLCTNSTKYGFVANLATEPPINKNCVIWLAPGRTCSMPVAPIYFGIDKFPANLQQYSPPQQALKNHFKKSEDLYVNHPNHLFVQIMDYCNYFDNNYKNLVGQRYTNIHSYERELFEKNIQAPHSIADIKQKTLNKITRQAIQAWQEFSNYEK
ncbi:MAG: C69 family dipeptidase [Candidatus Marinimicrobia bacterium]|nr:C69 family dipeptidase [Candidatus Neomarinimicrobiota bacterium]